MRPFSSLSIQQYMCPTDKRTIKHRLKLTAEHMNVKYEICKRCQPKIIAEIGVRAGYSALAFLTACPEAKYIGFDANNGTHGGQGGENKSFWLHAQKILSKYNCAFIEIDTQIIDRLPIDDAVDFFHVDGDHTTNGIKHDLNLALLSLEFKKGKILIDDIDYIPEVKQGIEEWLQGTKLQKEYIPSPRGEYLIHVPSI